VIWTAMRERKIPPERLASWMAALPARLVGLSGTKGLIVPGADADLVVVDPSAPFTVDAAALHQRHKLTPYHGRSLVGRVGATYLRGTLVFSDGRVVGTPAGRLLNRV
jgi:allantoinase